MEGDDCNLVVLLVWCGGGFWRVGVGLMVFVCNDLCNDDDDVCMGMVVVGMWDDDFIVVGMVLLWEGWCDRGIGFGWGLFGGVVVVEVEVCWVWGGIDDGFLFWVWVLGCGFSFVGVVVYEFMFDMNL